VAVDLSKVRTRVTQLLNAMTQNADGTPVYSSTVGDARRHASDISDAVDEAAVEIMKACCESQDAGLRQPFMAYSSVAHGDRLPQHYGPAGAVEIKAYSGAAWASGVPRPAAEIASLRDNPNSIYSDIAHDTEGSTIAGFFDLIDDVLSFTGYAARVPLATFVRADGATLLPDFSEPACIRIALGLLEKLGDPGLIQTYRAAGEADLASIRAGSREIAPVEGRT
jgi:hypothetical protein